MSPHWDVRPHLRTRDAHLRRARFAAAMARETAGATRATWREHARQHVKAARRENWIAVAQSRRISCVLWGRKTIGAHERAPRHGGAHARA